MGKWELPDPQTVLQELKNRGVSEDEFYRAMEVEKQQYPYVDERGLDFIVARTYGVDVRVGVPLAVGRVGPPLRRRIAEIRKERLWKLRGTSSV